nr:hypothetical protein [Lysobacter enzymogenes]
MYFDFGKPEKLSDLATRSPTEGFLKKEYEIAVIDDNPFGKAEVLRSHGFHIAETGDIRQVDQIASYAVVVCDIRGVGQAFGGVLEGAHLLSEIRKKYPDKFLIAYSGAESNMAYNDSLRSVDVSIPKDSQTEVWVQNLERGLLEVGDPFKRWIRFRTRLAERGVDAYELFKLEQKYIKAITKSDASILERAVASPEVKQLVVAFAKVAVPQLVKAFIGAPGP